MNTAALRHRPESEDCYLYTEGLLTLHFHTAKDDVAKVSLIYGDPYLTVLDPATKKTVWRYQTLAMRKIGTGQTEDYWSVDLRMPYSRLQYQFLVEGKDGTTLLYSDRGLREDTPANRTENVFRMPYFHELDRVKTPDWAKETVWYQIFPERFANGDKHNDPEGTKPWRPADHPGREDYYGGDLQGVLDHLDDLQALGVNGLYFCPLFTAASNHKYDTIDYFDIDPDFGDKALFAKLVSEAHQRGMKVMLDAVFNHIGEHSLQWQDVLKNGADSRFASWFHISNYPLTPFHDPNRGEGKPQYETFAFEPHMPKLNTANPEVQDYLLNVATYWIKTFDIDAWRLDVANEVDHHFWKRFYQATQRAKKDFLIIGEVWHSSQPWLNGDQFSGVMNYAYTEQIEDHFLTHKLSAKSLVELLTDQLMMYRPQNDQVMLNMLDSHDTARLLTVAHGDEDLALQALAFTFTQTGMPCIYYGTEMGMAGENDPDCRRPMDWSKLNGPVWQRVHALIAFRRKYAKTLGQGTTRLTVTPSGLIKVVRAGDAQIVAYFNTTAKPVALAATPALAQGYQAGQLAPKGFVLAAL
ncbi:glycoside hydrolase family 13 protein [Lacticaseibacillus camelliae]|uniref:Neopullulanase n=1 Tax=Lacticaseibacillus camelliae DSM 22697 = JCM 13995 TaxID=1423730 RepID=A0A0R2F2H3_9LACO|nr:glycoside hydrolase family 13 protein [Lacticaseibacillus camelliae]KRN22006.1 neopullulanase [Lacticaseibacillus camelliae DSM 22697 = JCM 13995]